MRHVLGFNHDSGALMGTSVRDELTDRFLPDIPYYKVNAVGNILKDLNQIYLDAKTIITPNMFNPNNIDLGTDKQVKTADSIAQQIFDGCRATIKSRDFTRGTLRFSINQNLMQVGTDKVFGTTDSLGIANKEGPIVTTYTLNQSYNFPFYQIKFNRKYYIVKGAVAKYYDHKDTGTTRQILSSDTISKMRLDSVQSQLLTRDFTPKKIRITTHYDKLAHVFLASIYIASVCIYLNSFKTDPNVFKNYEETCIFKNR